MPPPTHRMLQVGLIGLGTDWESHYRPAIQRLERRLQVRAVYTPACSRAASFRDFPDCDLAESLGDLIGRREVQAVLILDSAWHRTVPLEFACGWGKPALLADSATFEISPLQKLVQRSEDSGIPIVPDLLHRHTPASTRARELLATKLGRPLSIDWRCDAGQADRLSGATSRFLTDHFARGLDWCHSLTGALPAMATPAQMIAGLQGNAITVSFGPTADRGPVVTARLMIVEVPENCSGATLENPAGGALRIRVVCQKGWVELTDADHVRWGIGGEIQEEQLSQERSASEVLLDLFARRAVGGLIPLESLDQGVRARAWGAACHQAVVRSMGVRLDRRTGERIA